MKRGRKRKQSKSRQRKRASSFNEKSRSPRTAEDFFAMPESFQEKWIAITNAATKSRVYGMSIPKAAREFGVDPRIVRRLGRSAFRKSKNGRYVAKAWDRLLRIVVAITEGGLVELATRDSRQASKAGKHSSAVHRYLETGDASALLRLKDAYILDAEGKRVALLTDLEELDRLGSAGVLSFESLYARSL